MMWPLWKTVWMFLLKMKNKVVYDPAIPLLGIYLKKILIQKDICTPVFAAALFTIAKTWKQPKCLLTDKLIKKMWHACTLTHTMEYYSATKKENGIMSFAAK